MGRSGDSARLRFPAERGGTERSGGSRGGAPAAEVSPSRPPAPPRSPPESACRKVSPPSPPRPSPQPPRRVRTGRLSSGGCPAASRAGSPCRPGRRWGGRDGGMGERAIPARGGREGGMGEGAIPARPPRRAQRSLPGARPAPAPRGGTAAAPARPRPSPGPARRGDPTATALGDSPKRSRKVSPHLPPSGLGQGQPLPERCRVCAVSPRSPGTRRSSAAAAPPEEGAGRAGRAGSVLPGRLPRPRPALHGFACTLGAAGGAG